MNWMLSLWWSSINWGTGLMLPTLLFTDWPMRSCYFAIDNLSFWLASLDSENAGFWLASVGYKYRARKEKSSVASRPPPWKDLPQSKCQSASQPANKPASHQAIQSRSQEASQTASQQASQPTRGARVAVQGRTLWVWNDTVIVVWMAVWVFSIFSIHKKGTLFNSHFLFYSD